MEVESAASAQGTILPTISPTYSYFNTKISIQKWEHDVINDSGRHRRKTELLIKYHLWNMKHRLRNKGNSYWSIFYALIWGTSRPVKLVRVSLYLTSLGWKCQCMISTSFSHPILLVALHLKPLLVYSDNLDFQRQ